jgi:hypothetical protein
MPRMRLYQTPLGIVCADSRKDCRAILAVAGADPKAVIEPVRRARGVIFSVAGYIEPETIDQHVEKFKWMGHDERLRELIKLQNLPPDYGPLFGTTVKELNKEDDHEGSNRGQGPA